MTPRALIYAFATAALSIGLSGCLMDFDELFDGFGEEWDEPASSGNLNVRQGELRGAIGPVTGLNHSATELDAWSYGSTSHEVTVTVDTGHSAAMTRVEIDGPIDYESLPIGQEVLLYDSRHAYRSDVDVRVLGCSGPSVGAWDYDTYSDNTVVWVERRYENPRVVEYHYIADYPTVAGTTPSGVYADGTSVEGRFEVVY